MDTDIRQMMGKYNVKPEVLLHLDPGHRVLWVLEAPCAEVVRDFVYASGLARWNDFELYLTSSLEEIKAWTDPLPTIF